MTVSPTARRLLAIISRATATLAPPTHSVQVHDTVRLTGKRPVVALSVPLCSCVMSVDSRRPTEDHGLSVLKQASRLWPG